MITASDQWEIPRRVWAILLSWGLAVLMIAGLLSFWIWSNQRADAHEREQIQLDQDRAMCAIVRALVSGPEPPDSPEGYKAREFRRLMTDYQNTLHCQELETGQPGPARDRD